MRQVAPPKSGRDARSQLAPRNTACSEVRDVVPSKEPPAEPGHSGTAFPLRRESAVRKSPPCREDGRPTPRVAIHHFHDHRIRVIRPRGDRRALSRAEAAQNRGQ
jgi:hypothetical protein